MADNAITLSPGQSTEKQCRRDMLEFVSNEELQNFHITSLPHALKSIAAIWVAIAATLSASFLVFSANPYFFYPLAPVAAFFIATRFHALSVQVHEASHYSFDRRRRKLNDLIGNWLIGYWILFDVPLYRSAHEMHHRFLGTDGDPDLDFYNFSATGRSFFAKLVFKDLLLITAAERIWLVLSGKRAKQVASDAKKGAAVLNAHLLAKALVQTIVLMAFVALLGVPDGLIFWLVLWIIPLFAFFPLIIRWRTIAEHWYPPGDDVEGRFVSRSFTGRPFDIWLFGAQMRFHMEHHLYPAIPFHQLKALHGVLQERGFFDQDREGNHADLSVAGYLPFWKNLLSQSPVTSSAGLANNTPLT
ncbi:MAG: fatty acid desaturase family protein [Proteobacteria bacterium]|nr:fatty acid desaturase family protein [Pseudomonadota bacterium]